MPQNLPPELLLAIGRATRTADLPSLLLISTFHDHFFTETLLYSSIDLKDFRSTWRCLRTLCKAPTDCAFGGNLAGLVRSFHAAEFSYTRIRGKSLKGLQNMFTCVLPRLVNVQVFSTHLVRQLPLCILIDLLESCPGTLYSLDVNCAGTSEFRRSEHDLKLLSRDVPQLPQLTSLKLVGIYEKHSLCIQFLRRLCRTVASYIQTLHLDMLNNEPQLAMLSAAGTFQRLRELKVEGKMFIHPVFPHTAFPRLRALILRGERFFWQLPSPLDTGPRATRNITHYLSLSKLCCCARVIPSLFPFNIPSHELPPALHTVELDNTAYVLPPRYFDFVPANREEVNTAMILLQHSGVPIRHLRFCVAMLGGAAGEADFEEVLPMDMEGLESLTIIVEEDWCAQDGAMRTVSRMLANMPRLRALAFADPPRRKHLRAARCDIADIRTSQVRIVREWSLCGSVLRSISLTAGTEWVRSGAEWVLLEDLDDYEVVDDEKNLDDEDDEYETGNDQESEN